MERSEKSVHKKAQAKIPMSCSQAPKAPAGAGATEREPAIVFSLSHLTRLWTHAFPQLNLDSPPQNMPYPMYIGFGG